MPNSTALNRQVVGSIPTASTSSINRLARIYSSFSSDTGEYPKHPTSISAAADTLEGTPQLIQREMAIALRHENHRGCPSTNDLGNLRERHPSVQHSRDSRVPEIVESASERFDLL